jgi:hypothetical protein
MENSSRTGVAVFGINNLMEQVRTLSNEIGMECVDIIAVLHHVNRGAGAIDAYMAIKSIASHTKNYQHIRSLNKNDYIESSDELKDSDVLKTSGKKPKKRTLPLRATKALNGSNLVVSLNALAMNGSYSTTEDADAIAMIKHVTLSAGIHDRITKGKQDAHLETLDRIKAELAHRKTEISDIEHKCLQELRGTYPDYVSNTKLYFNAFVNGTPDAIIFGPNGNVIRCAEFKSTASSEQRSQKSNGKTQLILYMSIFNIQKGDLLIYNSTTESFEHIEVTASQSKVEEKVSFFLNFRQYLIDSNNDTVAHIDGLELLVKPNFAFPLYSAEAMSNKRLSQSSMH